MFKKKIIIIFMLFISLSVSFAKEIRTVTDDKVFVDWVFSPEVATYGGFNLDTYSYGLLGVAKTGLTSTIYKKADEILTGQGSFYGKIVIKDLEIKIDVQNGSSDYDSTKDNTKNPLSISWEKMEGWIYLGPIYLRLGNTEHDQLRFVSFEDEDELSFGNISYSVLPGYYSASYLGKANKIGSTDNPSGTISLSTAGTEESIINSFLETRRNQISLGFQLPEIFKVELGVSTAYTYIEEQFGIYNPFDVSLFAEMYLVRNLILQIKGNASNGRNYQSFEHNGGFMTDGNPLTTGLLVGYTFSFGERLNLTPKLGGEIQFENKQRVSSNNTGLDLLDTAYKDENNPTVFTYPYEVALGITLDWRTLGLKGDEDKSDDYVAFANRGIKVSDGVTLAGLYGQVPYDGVRLLYSPYIGVSITFWESENDEKGHAGIMKNLHMAFVGNYNYVFGNSMNIKGEANAGSKASTDTVYSKYNITLAPRMDVGAATEISYRIKYFRPFVGGIFKWLDITDTGIVKLDRAKKTPAGVETDESITFDQPYFNQMDLRVKGGFEVMRLITNTTLSAEWVSGDVFTELGNVNIDYNEYDFFKNNVSANSNDPSQASPRARLGYIALGVKITF